MDPALTQEYLGKVLSILKYALVLIPNPPAFVAVMISALTVASVVAFFYKQAANKVAWDKSQQIKKEERANNPIENEKIEKGAKQAEKDIEKLRKENPDKKKLPRPPIS